MVGKMPSGFHGLGLGSLQNAHSSQLNQLQQMNHAGLGQSGNQSAYQSAYQSEYQRHMQETRELERQRDEYFRYMRAQAPWLSESEIRRLMAGAALPPPKPRPATPKPTEEDLLLLTIK